MFGLRKTAFATAVLVCLVPASSALAAFQATGTGGGYSGARSVSAGSTPTTSVSGRNVTVSWAATGGNVPLDGYTVKRYSTGGVEQTIGAACTGTISGLTCAENSLPPGSWRYSVTPVKGNWKGAESAQSTAVTVGSPALSLTPSSVTSLPQNLTGSISNFSQGQTVTYRLDDPTSGTLLSGSTTPSSVPASGTATVSVTLPTSVANGSHTIYAIGSSGDSAGTSVTVAVPAATSITTSAWDIRDAATGSESNSSDPLAVASDGLTIDTSGYGTAFDNTRYDQADFNAPLRAGVAVSSATYSLRIAAPAGKTACFYAELRRASNPSTVLETDGSAASPFCVSTTTQTTTSIPLGSVTNTTIANDLIIRIYGRVSGGGSFTVDQSTISGTSADGNFTLYEDDTPGNNFGATFDNPWRLSLQDNAAFTSSSSFQKSYGARYVKFGFPAYAPSGATVNSATLTHAYRAGSGTQLCTYIVVYSGTTQIGTHGSTASNLSCNSSAGTDTIDTVSLPEVDTVAEANNLFFRVYAKSAANNVPMVSDQVKLKLDYTK